MPRSRFTRRTCPSQAWACGVRIRSLATDTAETVFIPAIQIEWPSSVNRANTASKPALVRLALATIICTFHFGCGSADVRLNDFEQDVGDPVTAYHDSDWATVLRENVSEGRVDYNHLSTHQEPLGRFLKILATLSPDSHPQAFSTDHERLCYYINAYNAGMLAAVLQAGLPDSLYSLAHHPDNDFALTIGARRQSLADLRKQAVEEARGDVRVLFALCSAAMGSPRLHEQPFRPTGLDEQLRVAAQRAMDNPQIVQVDHEHQELRVATWLGAAHQSFIDDYLRQTGAPSGTLLNALLQFARPVRREWLNTAVGYPVRLIPFDRSLNRWSPQSDQSPGTGFDE